MTSAAIEPRECNGVDVARTTQADALLPVRNLFMDVEGLADLLRLELQRSSWLNAYLLACGMNQALEDYLHPQPVLDRVPRLGRQAGRAFGWAAARLLDTARHLEQHARRLRHRARLVECQTALADVVLRLAELVVDTQRDDAHLQLNELRTAIEVAIESVRAGRPAFLREVQRLPACFRTFDQRPADLALIVDRFAQHFPNRNAPLLVVGIRTSGSYLAPLYAALLRRHGFEDVSFLTVRPGRPLLPHEHRQVLAVVRSGGRVLVTDDPPTTGKSVNRAVTGLEQYGVTREQVVLLLQLDQGQPSLPSRLSDYAAVCLPWDEWSIHDALAAPAIMASLKVMIDDGLDVRSAVRIPRPVKARGHIQALYRVELMERKTQVTSEELVCVRGAGLGYFGQHALAVEAATRAYLPRVYGMRGGLLFREWLPEEHRLSPAAVMGDALIPGQIASYVAARAHSTQAAEDASLRLVNRYPIWQCASDVLAYSFGGLAQFVRPVLHQTAQTLLRVTQPSVIDGHMELSEWFRAEEGRGLRKVSYDERAFCNLDRQCYDPAFDLAGVAASAEVLQFGDKLRRAYESAAGRHIDEERWFLYLVLHLLEWRRQLGTDDARLEEMLELTAIQYFEQTLFKDTRVRTSGPMCAIDIDGVLESYTLGFSATTPAGALSLRALTRHGYRPVVVTGRSLQDVRTRVNAYRLAGGVGEYGSVLYVQDTDTVHALLSDEQRFDLGRLRSALNSLPGVYVDASFEHAVRAYCLESGRRSPLTEQQIDAALKASDLSDRIRVIQGGSQTDFMVVGVDKRTGLRALADRINAEEQADGRLSALAVGDTVSDLPMLACASLAYAPENADSAVRDAGIAVLKAPRQAGLALAVGRLLGHHPGGCRTCRRGQVTTGADLLLSALGAQNTRKWGKLRIAALLALKVANSNWRTLPLQGTG